MGVYYRPYSGIMVADSLLNRLGNCNCLVQGFADDVVILISGKFLSTICDLMQMALNCVQNWCGVQIRHLWYFFTKRRNLEGFFAPRHGTGKISESHSR
jgi:hypothetical protein